MLRRSIVLFYRHGEYDIHHSILSGLGIWLGPQQSIQSTPVIHPCVCPLLAFDCCISAKTMHSAASFHATIVLSHGTRKRQHSRMMQLRVNQAVTQHTAQSRNSGAWSHNLTLLLFCARQGIILEHHLTLRV